jgi:LPS O-antigen subunit length determinant protein (WzzB/FepE family)
MRGLKRLVEAMYAVISDPRASRIERIESAKVIAACSGVLLPDTSEALLSTRQAVELRAARHAIAEKMQRRKERKRLENRRGYLKRKIRTLDRPAAHSVPQGNGGVVGTIG